MSLQITFPIFIILHAYLLDGVIAGGKNWNTLMIGMDKANHAFEVVCEYEVESTDECKGQFRRQQVNSQRGGLKDQPEIIWDNFGRWVKQQAMQKLPQVYQTECNKYLDRDKTEAKPPADESDALQDAGMEYPFKAFAHCMMKTLRSECGGEMPPEVEEAKGGPADAPEDYDD